MTSLTAYFGLYKIGELKDGNNVVVSGAAGATGSIVCQLAKARGCKVIGIAGTEEKCKVVVDDFKADKCINYKTGDITKEINDFFPDGVDVYFDNVGGQILDDMFPLMKNFGRIVGCGAISSYNESKEEKYGLKNYSYVVMKRLQYKGFIVSDFGKDFGEGAKELMKLYKEGNLTFKEDRVDGIENAAKAWIRLFNGDNIGKIIVKV